MMLDMLVHLVTY